MKAKQLSRSYRPAGLFVAVCFCLACPVNAQEPKPANMPTVNADGTTTSTEPVDYGKGRGECPFKGKGEKKTTWDKDGKVIKVEWVKKGVVRRAWFFKKDEHGTSITTYDYDNDGKPERKGEKRFDANGKALSEEAQDVKPDGTATGGDKYVYENGKWVTYSWDPESETWKEMGTLAYTPPSLETFLEENGVELKPSSAQQSSATGIPGARNREFEQTLFPSNQPGSRWSVSLGFMAQHSNVNFSFSHKAEDFGLVSEGSTDFFTGDGTVSYADGTVSFDVISDSFKLAPFTGGSVQSTGTGTIGSATVDTIDVTFHSTVINEEGGTRSSEQGSGKYAPYIQLSCKIAEGNWGAVSIFSQYAFYDINESSGEVGGGFRGDLHTFIYQGIDQMTGPDLVVYDPTVLNGAPFNANPPFSFPVDMISALRMQSCGELDLQQHVFTLGARAEMSCWDRYHLVVAGGPTLTHSCADFKARTDLWMGNVRWTTHEFSDSVHKFQLGFMAQAGVRIDLWRNVSLEVFGRYDWSDQLRIGDEQAKVELGNNSFGGGLGINFNF
jgi:hypothetical protein